MTTRSNPTHHILAIDEPAGYDIRQVYTAQDALDWLESVTTLLAQCQVTALRTKEGFQTVEAARHFLATVQGAQS